MRPIKNTILIYLITFLFILTCFSSLTNAIDENNTNKQRNIFPEESWHYLPTYPNYAPSGMPDFDQCAQDDWKSWGFFWSLCAPNAIANIFWWFDSKHSDPNGFPGDGNDTYPLVGGFYVVTPNIDDHSPTNVNFELTPLVRKYPSGELVEHIAWYVNNNYRRYYFFRY